MTHNQDGQQTDQTTNNGKANKVYHYLIMTIEGELENVRAYDVYEDAALDKEEWAAWMDNAWIISTEVDHIYLCHHGLTHDHDEERDTGQVGVCIAGARYQVYENVYMVPADEYIVLEDYLTGPCEDHSGCNGLPCQGEF